MWKYFINNQSKWFWNKLLKYFKFINLTLLALSCDLCYHSHVDFLPIFNVFSWGEFPHLFNLKKNDFKKYNWMLNFQIVNFFSIIRKLQHIVKISKINKFNNSYMVCNQIWLNLLINDHYLLPKIGEQITSILVQHISYLQLRFNMF